MKMLIGLFVIFTALLPILVYAEAPSSQGAQIVLLTGAHIARGERLYRSRCGACHSLDANRIGPRHRGIFGRRAGAITDYHYSPALSRSSVVWTVQNLHDWLANPERLIPGQRMGIRVKRAADRRDIIAYLRNLSPNRP